MSGAIGSKCSDLDLLLPRVSDPHANASHIKAAFTVVIVDFRADTNKITNRVGRAESTLQMHLGTLRRTFSTPSTHSQQFLVMFMNMEDQDKRGRWHTIRIWGLPKSEAPDALETMVTAFFNDLLGRTPETPMETEQIHRALQPRRNNIAPLRDVIGCIGNFPLKEPILKKAQECEYLLFGKSQIQLYQDLSPLTLQQRKALRSLLNKL